MHESKYYCHLKRTLIISPPLSLSPPAPLPLWRHLEMESINNLHITRWRRLIQWSCNGSVVDYISCAYCLTQVFLLLI